MPPTFAIIGNGVQDHCFAGFIRIVAGAARRRGCVQPSSGREKQGTTFGQT